MFWNKQEMMRTLLPKTLGYRLKQIEKSLIELYTLPVRATYDIWNVFWIRKR